MRIGTTINRNNKDNSYTLLKSTSNNTNGIKIHSDIFPKRKYIVLKSQTEVIDWIMNLSTKVISKDYYISALTILKTNLNN